MRSALIACGVIACLSAAGCVLDAASVIGSGRQATQSRAVPAFSAIVVRDSIAAQIQLVSGGPQSVVVTDDDNIVPLVETRVTAGELVLDLPPRLILTPRLPLVVTISAKAQERLETHDSSTASADVVRGPSASVTSTDSSKMAVGEITSDGGVAVSSSDSSQLTSARIAGQQLAISSSDSSKIQAHAAAISGPATVDTSDSSQVTVDGEAESLDAHTSDSSHLAADGLTVADVTIEGSDSSRAWVCATGSLDAALRDSSEVTYTCHPQHVTRHLQDSASLTEE
jgi:hypothetical protein